MLQLGIYTDKSKKSILRAINMTEECGYEYLEPQVLMAGIVNEGRDMLLYVLQFLQVDKVGFCKRINETIAEIDEFSNDTPILSESTTGILSKAEILSAESGCELIPIEFLLLSMILIPSKVKDVFTSFGVDEIKLIEAISHYRGDSDIESGNSTGEANTTFPNLERFGRNLCADARNDLIHKAIGRDDEIRRIIHILSRQTKNNPILVGEPGTGKTAIVEGLAHRIVEGDIPRELRGVQLYSLNITSLIAGASHMGEFEERLRGVIDDVSNSDGKVILFIDEIHLLIGEGRSGGAMDAANIMKPELARGKIKVIGATTLEEYKQYIEKDKAFERRFQKVSVEEPDEESALAILRGIRWRLEDFHKIRIKDEAIRASVKLSMRYIQDRFLPDKAIDLLDEAAAKMKIARSTSPLELDSLRRKITTKEIECESLKRDDESNPIVIQLQEEISNLKEEENSLHAKWQSERRLLEDIQERRNKITRLTDDKLLAENQGAVTSVVDLSRQISEINEEINYLMESLQDDNDSENLLKPELDEVDVMSVITEWTGIPISKLSQNETQKLAHIEDYLNNSVVGQDEAKVLIANAIRRNKMGFSDANKPIGTFLFLGTTGVGKTELCKALSEFLFDSRDALIRIDMSEYQQEHEVSKLFGAPPGYIGFENGGQLTEAVRRKPYSVILFDEIEKAHPKVFEALLQVLDEGRMTDGKGRTINFKNTIIVMTSNLGHQIIYSTLQGRRNLRGNRIGFNVSENDNIVADNNLVTEEKIAKAKKLILTELKSKVAPEFVNRIDDIIMFLPLSKEDIRKIVQLQIRSIAKNLKSQGVEIQVTDDAIDFLVSVGFQPEYGARPVKRAINSFLIDDMSISIINGEISKDSPIQISSDHNNLKFTNI